jgi:hypothetical protein
MDTFLIKDYKINEKQSHDFYLENNILVTIPKENLNKLLKILEESNSKIAKKNLTFIKLMIRFGSSTDK